MRSGLLKQQSVSWVEETAAVGKRAGWMAEGGARWSIQFHQASRPYELDSIRPLAWEGVKVKVQRVFLRETAVCCRLFQG